MADKKVEIVKTVPATPDEVREAEARDVDVKDADTQAAKMARAQVELDKGLEAEKKAQEHQAETDAKVRAELVKAAAKPPEDLPEPLDPATAAELAPVDLPVAHPVYEHPDDVKGYQVLDLTGAYNQSHPSEAVPGLFRVTHKGDPDATIDVQTDAPYNRLHGANRLSPASEQLIKAAVDKLEALRKL